MRGRWSCHRVEDRVLKTKPRRDLYYYYSHRVFALIYIYHHSRLTRVDSKKKSPITMQLCRQSYPTTLYLISTVIFLIYTTDCVQSFSTSANPITKKTKSEGLFLIKKERDNSHDDKSTRRCFLLSSSCWAVIGAAAGTGTTSLFLPIRPSFAAYGDSSNMELPNYIEFLMEKNAVANPDTFLYKGPDPKVQLQRLLDASQRLKDIPTLAEEKKWSQVQGILTGPLGTLAETLNRISKDSSPEVQAKAKKVKEDIFAISTAASKKSTEAVIAKTSAAAADLEAFVKAAF